MNYPAIPILSGHNKPELIFHPELGRYYFKSPIVYDDCHQYLGLVMYILQKNEPWASYGYGYYRGVMRGDYLVSPAIKLAHDTNHVSIRTNGLPWKFTTYNGHVIDIADFYNAVHLYQYGKSWKEADLLRNLIINIHLKLYCRLRILLWPKKLRIQFDGKTRLRFDYEEDAFPFHYYDHADDMQKLINLINNKFNPALVERDPSIVRHLRVPQIDTEEDARWFAIINLMAASDVMEGTNNLETVAMMMAIS